MRIHAVFLAELRKYFLEIKNYYPDHIGNLVTTYIFFMGFFFIVKSGSDYTGAAGQMGQSIIGFFIWFFSTSVVFESSVTISEEKRVGTLEQILLKPAGFVNIMLARSVCWAIVSFVEVSFLLIFIAMTTGVSVPFKGPVIPVMLLTMVGLYGFGFIMSGLTILYTKTASFSSILNYFFLFFTGAMVKVEVLPPVLRSISKSLPLTQGISLAKDIVATDLSWAMFLSDG
jgi:ABC-2 type transport system permease protein